MPTSLDPRSERSASAGQDLLTLEALVGLMRRSLALVLGCAALGGVLVAGAVWLFEAPVYKATASVILPGAARGSGWNILTPEGYRQLLLHDSLVEEARQRVAAAGLEPGPVRLGENLEADLMAASRKADPAAAQLVSVEVRNPSAEAAAALANAWAEVFLERCAKLTEEIAVERLEEFDAEAVELRAELADLQAERLELLAAMEVKSRQVADRWRNTLARAQRETGRLERDHRLETERQLAELRQQRGTAAREARRQGLEERLRTATAEELAELSRQLGEVEAALAADRLAAAELEDGRRRELDALLEKRALARQDLERKRDLEIEAAIDQAQEMRLDEVEWRIRQLDDILMTVARNYGATRIGRGEGYAQIGVEAMPPSHAQPRRTVLKGLVGAVVGGLAGLLLALVLEAGRRRRAGSSSPG